MLKVGLQHVVAARLPDGTARELASNWCLAILLGDAKLGAKYRCRLERLCDFPHLLRLLWHVPVLLMLASERIANELHSGNSCPVLGHLLARELVNECATLIRNDQTSRRPTGGYCCREVQSSSRPQPACCMPCRRRLASGTAGNIGWRKPAWTGVLGTRLHGAYLQNAAWPGIVLSAIDPAMPDLTNAAHRGESDDAIATCVNLRAPR